MNIFYRQERGKLHWWTYLLTIVLVFSGIWGFGNLPLAAALHNHGYSYDQIQKLTIPEMTDILGRNTFFCLQMFPFIAGIGCMLFAFRFIHLRKAASFFTSRPVLDFKRFITAFSLTLAVSLVFFFIGYFTAPDMYAWNFKPREFGILILITVFLLPLQTGFEELFFRSYLLQWIGRAKIRGIAVILINGLIFGSFHLLNPEVAALGWFAVVYYIVSGVFMALITVMDDGLELSWGFHTANNVLPILILTNSYQVIQTDALLVVNAPPSVGPVDFLVLLIMFPVLYFVFARIYKWGDWKKRLL